MHIATINLMLCIVGMVFGAQDYYGDLGIDKGASKAQIKKEFRKLAVKYHPDKNPDPSAQERFRQIVEAYEVLSDDEKRSSYDTMGHANYKKSQSSGGARNWGSEGGGFPFNFDDLFKEFEFGDEDGFSYGEPFVFRSGFDGGHPPHHSFMDFDDADDLMDLDDILGSFDSFGSQESFFGNHFAGNHFRNHFENHRRNHHHHQHGGHYHHYSSNSPPPSTNGGGRRCKTVTQKIGNMITTHTTCT